MKLERVNGFTLAEILISLGILGVIATFTIPKVLMAQQDQKYNAIAKENIAMVAAAFQQAQLAGNISANTTAGDLTQYMNYVAVNTREIDASYTQTNFGCTATNPCLFMANGSALRYSTTNAFGGTDTTNSMWFYIDPDGSYGGTTDGPSKSVGIFLYYNGRIIDQGNLLTGTTNSNLGYTADPGRVPPWFRW